MGTLRLIYLLFSIFETFGQLNSKDSDALLSKNVFAGTTSGKVSNVLRDILNQESLVRFSMVQKIQSLVLDAADRKTDKEYMKKKLHDITEELQSLRVKNRRMDDENERLRQELEALSVQNNHTIELLKPELLLLKNQTFRLQKENDVVASDTIEINKQLREFNKTFDFLKMKMEEVKKEFHQNIEGLKMEVKENKNSNEAQKIGLGDLEILFTEHIKIFNESRTAFQQELETLNKRMENTEKQDNLSSRVHVVEDSLRRFSLSVDDLRAAQNVSNKQLLSISTETELTRDCKDLHEMGVRKSAVYDIYPRDNYVSKKNPVQVYCDMSTAGGGWTVIQNRTDGKVNFNRTWEEYKAGFGDVSTSYWIGNDVIYELTKENSSSLYVSITAQNGTSFFIQYDTFSIAGENDDYRLYIAGNAKGTLDDRIRYGTGGDNINGMKFSTFDKDNDPSSGHCTDSMGVGGWWFNRCNDAYTSTDSIHLESGVNLGMVHLLMDQIFPVQG